MQENPTADIAFAAVNAFPEAPESPLVVESPVSVAEQVEQYQEAPEDEAARIYGQLMPQFDKQVSLLSKKGYYRVLAAITKIPFIDVNFKMSDLENNVCTLVSRLLQCKMVMETSVMYEIVEKEQAKAKAAEEAKNGTV